MNNTGLLSFNYLYEEAEKDLYYNFFKNKIERLSKTMASKFYNFCNKIFDREEESLNLDESFQDCDLLVKTRTFFWEISKENSIEEDGTIKKYKISSGFFTELLIKLHRQIILFFEFDDIDLFDFDYQIQYNKYNSDKTGHLNNRFKLYYQTNRLSDNKTINYLECSANISQKILLSDKTNYFVKKFKTFIRQIKYYFEINNILNGKKAYIYLYPSHLLENKNYDMRFN
jgi:hypothetical protein